MKKKYLHKKIINNRPDMIAINLKVYKNIQQLYHKSKQV
jgi:hypothetical protein